MVIVKESRAGVVDDTVEDELSVEFARYLVVMIFRVTSQTSCSPACGGGVLCV